MKTFELIAARTRPLIERLDRQSLRERALVFGAGVALIYMAWQMLLMDPLTRRAHVAEQHLTDLRQRVEAADAASTAAAQNPAIAAAMRNQALKQRLAQVDTLLAEAARGYVSPDRVAELLRELLASQHGLTLISLRNMPVESLSRPAAAAEALPGSAAAAPDAVDRGPFLHPVELVVEGDYLSVVAYLQALEQLPWRMHWERLELKVGTYPANRVRIVIGALSLSRDWMSV
jgi:MSHA biogenesis protein MshJ